MNQPTFSSHQSVPSETQDSFTRSMVSRQQPAFQSRQEIDTKVSSKTQLSAKSEFAQQIEKEMGVVESVNHEIYVKKISLNADFKKLEEELAKRDKKLSDKVMGLRQTIDQLLENNCSIFRQHSKLFSKMLEKDANYKRQTVAMIMNLEANMKSYKNPKESAEPAPTDPPRPSLDPSKFDEIVSKYVTVLRHKEQVILKAKEALSKKAKSFQLLHFKYLAEKNLYQSLVSSVIEKSCFSGELFNESLENFKKVCSDQGLEFRTPADMPPPAESQSQTKILKEAALAVNHSSFLKMISDKAQSIHNKSIIYNQQAERIAKFQEKIEKLQSDQAATTLDSASQMNESEIELQRIRNQEKNHIAEGLKRDCSANEKILEEIKRMKSELVAIYNSVAAKNRTASKIIKRQMVENDGSFPNARLNQLFAECMMSENELAAHSKRSESARLLSGFLMIENFFRNGCLKKISKADTVGDIRDLLAKPKSCKQIKDTPISKDKIKLEAPHRVTSIKDIKENYMKLKHMVEALAEIGGDPDFKQLGQDITQVEGRLTDGRESGPTSARSVSKMGTPLHSFSKHTSDIQFKMARLQTQLKQKVSRVMPAIYEFIILLHPPEENKKSSSSHRVSEVAHLLIRNLSEKLAESKNEMMEAENKRGLLQEKFQEEIRKISTELKQKAVDLQQATLEKSRLQNKADMFAKSIQKLEDDLIFERSRHDNLKKQKSQNNQTQVEKLEAEVEHLKSLLKKEIRQRQSESEFQPREARRRSFTVDIEKELSLSQKSPKAENYFEKIRNGPAMSQKARGEPMPRSQTVLDEVPSEMRRSFGSNEIRATPRFSHQINLKKDLAKGQSDSDTHENIYNIYQKHFSEVPQILDKRAEVPRTHSLQTVGALRERIVSQSEHFFVATEEFRSSFEAIKDKLSVMRAVLTKTKLIIDIFKSRSPPALVALIESTFNNLGGLQIKNADVPKTEDLLITLKMLQSENGLLKAQLKVLERENQKLKDCQLKARNSSKNMDPVRKDLPDSKPKTPPNQSSSRKIEIFEPKFSMQSSAQSIEIHRELSSARRKPEQSHATAQNFEKRRGPMDVFEINQGDISFGNERFERSTSRSKQRSHASGSAREVNFSFSLPTQIKGFQKPGAENDYGADHDSSREYSRHYAKKHDSDMEIGSQHELNLYGAMQPKNDPVRGAPIKKTLYTIRGSGSNNEIQAEDLDESYDKLFYKKVIDNFFPESNEESINRERKNN